MSLEGAKFICLDEAGNHGEMVLAKGRKFTVGYYVSCDFVLADERAKGVHCEIECDAFGRVSNQNYKLNLINKIIHIFLYVLKQLPLIHYVLLLLLDFITFLFVFIFDLMFVCFLSFVFFICLFSFR